jgi:hypothetical protein
VTGAPLLDLVLVLAAIWLAWQLRRLWLVLAAIWLGLIAKGGALYVCDGAVGGHLWAIALAIGVLAALVRLSGRHGDEPGVKLRSKPR